MVIGTKKYQKVPKGLETTGLENLHSLMWLEIHHI